MAPSYRQTADVRPPWSLASPVEIFSRRKGTAAAVSIARRHRGTQFDPAAVDLFCEHAADLLDSLDQASGWDVILDTEPPLSRRIAGADLDGVLEAMADLVDLKSPYMAGHSRGVANLAGEAARVSGQPADAVSTLRRAGLIHDLGRLGVSSAIWDKPGPLTQAESERVRLHPYLTDRMLARVSVLGPSREIAARHHERLDGSGYPRNLTAASLTPSDRLLAAADAYHAMTEPRPHRAPLDPDQAFRDLRTEITAGRLDGTAVDAVLAAAGHRAPARHQQPGGLTARGRGARLACPRPVDQGDRPATGDIAEDCGQPRRAHLRQARCFQPRRGDAVRHTARPNGRL
jgi:HD-GYP domain-containing protein (c-di-GMP phosphodiesterase class II)